MPVAESARFSVDYRQKYVEVCATSRTFDCLQHCSLLFYSGWDSASTSRFAPTQAWCSMTFGSKESVSSMS